MLRKENNIRSHPPVNYGCSSVNEILWMFGVLSYKPPGMSLWFRIGFTTCSKQNYDVKGIKFTSGWGSGRVRGFSVEDNQKIINCFTYWFWVVLLHYYSSLIVECQMAVSMRIWYRFVVAVIFLIHIQLITIYLFFCWLNRRTVHRMVCHIVSIWQDFQD